MAGACVFTMHPQIIGRPGLVFLDQFITFVRAMTKPGCHGWGASRSSPRPARGAACVVLAPGRSLTCEQVTGLFHDRLAAYKHPRHVVFLDALPRTTTGKIDRARLRALTVRHVAPVSPGPLSPARQST